jgi:hypothetical protein
VLFLGGLMPQIEKAHPCIFLSDIQIEYFVSLTIAQPEPTCLSDAKIETLL